MGQVHSVLSLLSAPSWTGTLSTISKPSSVTKAMKDSSTWVRQVQWARSMTQTFAILPQRGHETSLLSSLNLPSPDNMSNGSPYSSLVYSDFSFVFSPHSGLCMCMCVCVGGAGYEGKCRYVNMSRNATDSNPQELPILLFGGQSLSLAWNCPVA